MSFHRNIRMDLNTDSIDAAIREIRNLRKRLEDRCNELVKILVEAGVPVAQMEVIRLDAVMSGELADSVEGVFFKKERMGVIYTDAPHALYVEYGTGIVGEENPNTNPEGNVEWEYDIHNHRQHGWWYPADFGWWIPKEGKYTGQPMAWTKGMPARPFLYNTLRWLQDYAPGAAGRTFANL